MKGLDDVKSIHMFLKSNGNQNNTSIPSTSISRVVIAENDLMHAEELSVNNVANDGVPLVSLALDIKILIIVVLTLSLLTGSFFKCVMYGYVFISNKQNRGWMHRPINVLTITSAIIHHFTHLWLWIWYLVEMLDDTPVSQSVGSFQCQLNQWIGLFGLGYQTVGSLGIAIYRLFYLKHEEWVKYVIGEKILLVVVLASSLMLCGLLVFLYDIETNSHRFGRNMCHGISGTQAQIMIDYEISRGKMLITTTYIQKAVVSIILGMQSIEFTIYIWFCRLRYKNDNGNIKKVLTEDVIRARNMKNIGTFLGQAYAFLTEYAFVLSVLIIIFIAGDQTNDLKAITNIAKFVDFGLLSAVEVFASPILRGYLMSMININNT